MTDERIKEEFEKWAKNYKMDIFPYPLILAFCSGASTGERLGKIEALEELIEYIHDEHQTPSSIVAYLSRRINELMEERS